jgi:hypothetical protein
MFARLVRDAPVTLTVVLLFIGVLLACAVGSLLGAAVAYPNVPRITATRHSRAVARPMARHGSLAARSQRVRGASGRRGAMGSTPHVARAKASIHRCSASSAWKLPTLSAGASFRARPNDRAWNGAALQFPWQHDDNRGAASVVNAAQRQGKQQARSLHA